MFKKRILSLALVLSLSFCSFLPAAADTSTEATTSTEQQGENDTTGKTETLFEKQHFKDAMTFLAALNPKRIQQGFAPLLVNEELLTATQTRAEELEISYGHIRPDKSHSSWETCYAEQGFITDFSKLENGYEFIGTEASNALSIYQSCRSKHSSVLYRNDLSLIGLGYTDGSVYIYNEEKDSSTEKKNPWVVHLLGRYTVSSLELASPLEDTYPTGYSLSDMNIILKATMLSPEGKKVVGYLPLVDSMAKGYVSSKAGKQTVTVVYSSPYYKNSDTKKTYKAYEKTLTINITTKKGATPSKPETFQATGTSYNKVTVTWSPSENAQSYDIYRSKKKKSGYEKIVSLKASDLTLSEEGLYTYIDEDVKNGIKYYYKLRGVNGSVNGSYTSVDEALPNIKAPTGLKCSKKTKTTITVKWSKVDKATSYRVYYSTKKSGKYKRATKPSTKKCSYTIKKLKKKKTYYIKVLAYRDGRPSSYSKIIKVKTK